MELEFVDNHSEFDEEILPDADAEISTVLLLPSKRNRKRKIHFDEQLDEIVKKNRTKSCRTSLEKSHEVCSSHYYLKQLKS